MVADSEETLRLAYQHLTIELGDVRHQLSGLAQTLQALPAVGAVTLALFAALATLPAYRDPLPTVFLALGLLPFVLLVAVSVLEFGRSSPTPRDVHLALAEDQLPVSAWLTDKIGARRLEIRVLELATLRKRGRLRFVSALLAIQVGYLLVVTVAVALMGDPH